MKPMSIIVVTLTKMFSWFIIMLGAIIIINGHATPGGGFQGGAVVATFICFMLAAWGGKKTLAWANTGIYSALESAGLLIFFALACFGLPKSFAFNFLAVPLSGGDVAGGWLPSCGTISLMNVAVGLEVIGALSLTVLEMYGGTHLDENMGGECGHDRV